MLNIDFAIFYALRHRPQRKSFGSSRRFALHYTSGEDNSFTYPQTIIFSFYFDYSTS